MNVRHRLIVMALCPSGGQDVYEVEVETDRFILVEDILEAANAATVEPIYQEDLTTAMARMLGAKVTTVGQHQQVMTTAEDGDVLAGDPMLDPPDQQPEEVS